GIEVEAERLAGLQMDAPGGEAADAQLRALHVGEDADRPSGLLLQVADQGDAGGVSSCVPWLKLRRKTSAPAWNSRDRTSAVELAGPSVAMILVRRWRRSGVRTGMRAP